MSEYESLPLRGNEAEAEVTDCPAEGWSLEWNLGWSDSRTRPPFPWATWHSESRWAESGGSVPIRRLAPEKNSLDEALLILFAPRLSCKMVTG